MERISFTGFYICAYVLAINLWMYLLVNGHLTLVENRVSAYAISLFMAICLFMDFKHGNKNPLIDIAFSCLIINFIINILNYTGVFGYDAPNMFIGFNGLVFVVTSMILISGGRHGTFSN